MAGLLEVSPTFLVFSSFYRQGEYLSLYHQGEYLSFYHQGEYLSFYCQVEHCSRRPSNDSVFLWDDPAAIGMLLTDEEEEETLLARDDKVTKLLDELWSDITFSDGHDRGIVAGVDDRKDRNWEKGGEIQ